MPATPAMARPLFLKRKISEKKNDKWKGENEIVEK